MANTALTFTDIWSSFHNQAGLGYVESFTAGVFYESRFLVDGMAFAGFAAATALGKGAIGLNYSNFGYGVYNEGKLGLAYGMKLAERFSIGVQLNYHTTRIAADDYGNAGALTAEVGVRMEVSERVTIAAHLFNPTRTTLIDNGESAIPDEKIPTLIRLGVGYQISDEVLLAGEVEKDIDQNALFRGGIEYQPVDILYLRLGASSEPSLFSFGLGLRFESFQFDLASSYSSVLGYSPQVSLTYNPGKK
ncbi:MAG: hypothetical protein ACI8QH_000694 [Flammeovirgaceae bacterium]|jgi:hypothetical protein